jgi:DNA-binding response OmpR family regulator
MRILLVEDNRDILANLADYLGLKGYTVDCAQDGLSACIWPPPSITT